MGHFPSESERRALIEGLRELAAQCGPEWLFEDAIVEPKDKVFPDRWEPSAHGVEVLGG